MKGKSSTLLIAIGLLIFLVVFGTWFFTISEGWRWVEAMYFTVMTMTTVGYGDFVPSHDLSKIVTIVYSLISIPTMLFVFGFVAEHYFERKIVEVEKRLKIVLAEEKKIEKEIEAEAQ